MAVLTKETSGLTKISTPLNYPVVARNILMQTELKKVLRAFSKEGIDVILLKGAAFLLSIYPSLDRPMSDIDVLIKAESVKNAENVLKILAYQPLEDSSGTHFFNKNNNLLIDLHWDTSSGLGTGFRKYSKIVNLDYDNFWQRAEVKYLNNLPVKILSDEDAILFLCHHLTITHFFGSQNSLSDLSELMAKKSIDWHYVARQATKSKLFNTVSLCLVLSDKQRGRTNVTNITYRKFFPLNWRARLLLLILGDIDSPNNENLTQQYSSWGRILLRDNWIDSFRTVSQIFFPPVEWIAIKYKQEGIKRYFYKVFHPFIRIFY